MTAETQECTPVCATNGTCDSSAVLDPDSAAAASAVFKALADPLRLRMLAAIASDPRGESCVCDLACLAEVSQPTVSHHLKALRTTGLVESERRGTWVWYRLVPGALSGATEILTSLTRS